MKHLIRGVIINVILPNWPLTYLVVISQFISSLLLCVTDSTLAENEGRENHIRTLNNFREGSLNYKIIAWAHKKSPAGRRDWNKLLLRDGKITGTSLEPSQSITEHVGSEKPWLRIYERGQWGGTCARGYRKLHSYSRCPRHPSTLQDTYLKCTHFLRHKFYSSWTAQLKTVQTTRAPLQPSLTEDKIKIGKGFGAWENRNSWEMTD